MLHFVQHAGKLLELGLEIFPHERQNLDDGGVPNRVENLVAHLAVDDDLLGAQYAQVLRNIRLLDAKFLDQYSRRNLALAEDFKNCNAGRVRERLKNIGLETSQGVWHIRILAYSN